jgi:hypothetical protein
VAVVATQPLTDMRIGSPWSVARYGVPQRRGGEPPCNTAEPDKIIIRGLNDFIAAHLCGLESLKRTP